MSSTQRAETYGPFPGGDPRRFTPDREVCTPAQIERWQAACQQWREGRGEDTGPGCSTFGDGTAVSGEGFGVGTFDFGEMPDDQAIEEVGRLEADIATLQQLNDQASLLLATQDMEITRYRKALETISEDENASYLACADMPYCTGGILSRQHSKECAVRIAWDALNPEAAQ